MWMIMYLDVSATSVTLCAFSPSRSFMPTTPLLTYCIQTPSASIILFGHQPVLCRSRKSSPRSAPRWRYRTPQQPDALDATRGAPASADTDQGAEQRTGGSL